MEGHESSKRKASNDAEVRNVKPKSQRFISDGVSEDDAYMVLAHVPHDQDFFRNIARDLVRRSEPERRFQDAMLDDIMARVNAKGLDRSRAATVRDALNRQLTSHLIKQFGAGIGRTQPTLKHLRDVLLHIAGSFGRAHPSQMPPDLVNNMRALFQNGSGASGALSPVPNESSTMSPVDVEGSTTQQSRTITNTVKTPMSGNSTTFDGEAQSSSGVLRSDRARTIPTEPVKSSAVNGVSSNTKKPDTQSMDKARLSQPRENDVSVADPAETLQPKEQDGNIVTEEGKQASVDGPRHLPSSQGLNVIHANVTNGGEAPAATRVSPSIPFAPVARMFGSGDIDALIDEYGPGQTPAGSNGMPASKEISSEASNDASKDAPVETFKTPPSKRTGLSTADNAQGSKDPNHSHLESGRKKSDPEQPTPSQRPVTLAASPSYDWTPTSDIEPKSLTCWYWYYRQPSCQHLRRTCYYAHDVKSHVAARTKTEPPMRLDQGFARKRMTDLGQLNDESPRRRSSSDTLNIRGGAQRANLRLTNDDVAIKREPGVDSAPPTSQTPVMDLLIGARRETIPANRDAILDDVHRDLRRRGHPDDYVTTIQDNRGRVKDLSFDGHSGLESNMAGLFATFHHQSTQIRKACESLLRPLIVANALKFPEFSDHLLESWNISASAGPSPNHPKTFSRTSSRTGVTESYHRKDVGADLRGGPSDDYDRKYESWGSRERTPTYNDHSMTCPYWLNPGCEKGTSCKFTHAIRPFVAGMGGRMPPSRLAPDGTVLKRSKY